MSKKYRSTYLFRILIPILLLFSLSNLSFAQEKQTIKVAYIPDNSHYTMEENGGLSGYNFDYLMLVAQYTNWNYEFVEIDQGNYQDSFLLASKMIENGEVDLIGSVEKTPENEEIFEFPSLNTGVNRHCLYALVTNTTINQDNYFQRNPLTIALVEDSKINDTFFALATANKLNYEIIYVKTQEEAVDLLEKGEVELITHTDTDGDSWKLNYLSTLDRTPFYFVSKKGNSDLMEELSQAIAKINVAEPTVHQRLLDDYFGTKYSGNLVLSQEEEEALQDFPYLTVGLLKGREPYQFFAEDDEGIPKGISVEILEEISQIIGVEFRYVWLESREEMRDKIASQEIDLCSTVPYDSDFQLNSYFDVVITQPYLSNPVAWLHQTGENQGANPLYYYLADNIPLFPDDELMEIWDLEEALENLSFGGSTSIFTDPYMAQYLLQKMELTNVESQTLSSLESKICFGVGKHLDPAVVGLFNQALLHLDPFVVDEIIYRNVSVDSGMTLKAFYQAHSSYILLTIVLFFLTIVIFLVWNSGNLKRITEEDSLTKLYNAGFFHEYAEEKSKKLQNGCLILIDIDYFKQVNDTFGHHEGDNIIIKVAKTLRNHFREQDIVARLGGDEFIILLEEKPDLPDVEQRCQKILNSLVGEDTKVPVTLSIGGYLFSQPTTYNELYKKADAVLYKVKENGRNGFRFEEK